MRALLDSYSSRDGKAPNVGSTLDLENSRTDHMDAIAGPASPLQRSTYTPATTNLLLEDTLQRRKTDNWRRDMVSFFIRRLGFLLLALFICCGLLFFSILLYSSLISHKESASSRKGYRDIRSLDLPLEEYFNIMDQEAPAPHLNLLQHSNGNNDVTQISQNLACKIALITTFPPEKCGIAQFSSHLRDSIQRYFDSNGYKLYSIRVFALHDHSRATFFRDYDTSQVDYVIDLDDNLPSKAIYLAAKYINDNQYTHVILQTEFGLTPVMWQQTDLLRWISPSIPIFVTLHNPKAFPSNEDREFIFQLGLLAKKLFVMSKLAKYSLENTYNVDPDKVCWIPHGVKDVFLKSDRYFDELPAKYEWARNKLIILSNGLIHQWKGYDKIIEVLPRLAKVYPNILFLVVGQEHWKNTNYGQVMKGYFDQAEAIGADKYIKWINSYVTDEELIDFFKLSALYVTMYDEITPVSGTLTAAMAAGMAVVSTPYNYAQEMLSLGNTTKGLVLEFYDKSSELEETLNTALSSKDLRDSLGQAARFSVADWSWDKVGELYVKAMGSSLPEEPEEDMQSFLNVFGTNATAVWYKNAVKTFYDHYIYDPSNVEGLQQLLQLSNPEVLKDHDKLLEVKRVSTANETLLDSSNHYHESFFRRENTRVLTLLSDIDIQVNAVIGDRSTLKTLGIRGHFGWLLLDEQDGLDAEFLDDAEFMEPKKVEIDWKAQSVLIQTKNFVLQAKLIEAAILFSAEARSVTCFPHGLLGSDLRTHVERKKFKGPFSGISGDWLQWQSWLIKDSFLFSTAASGQRFDSYGINGNVFKSQRLQPLAFNRSDISIYKKAISAHEFRSNFSVNAERVPSILLQIQGNMFDHSGFAHVNREMFFHLLKSHLFQKVKILMKLIPGEFLESSDFNITPNSVVKILAYQNYRVSYMDIGLPDCTASATLEPPSYTFSYGQAQFYDYVDAFEECVLDTRRFRLHTPPDVVFKNAWEAMGPNLADPPASHTKWIHQQPWEFYGFPTAWLDTFQHKIDRLWIPSEYCAESFIANGIPPSKVNVISHGIDFEKRIALAAKFPSRNATSEFDKDRPLRIFYGGGSLERKGIDVLISAYGKAFSKNDHVQLLIHAPYGNGAFVTLVKDMVDELHKRPDGPAVEFIFKELEDDDIVTRYKTMDVLVNPYRSEGFGLMMLEAMTYGCPVIVPSYGPAIEFTDASCAFFVEPRRPEGFGPTSFSDSFIEPCLNEPCDKMKIFGHDTTSQPRWSVPSETSLIKILQEIYHKPALLEEKRKHGPLLASRLRWSDIVTSRIYPLLFNITLIEDPTPARIASAKAHDQPSLWHRLISAL